MTDPDSLDWFTSSYSNDQGGQCVEVGVVPSVVHVRDSKDTSIPGISVSSASWTAFISNLPR
ncbi:DUF397 domain-containing protein [Streptomyces sp. NPDC087440]|uniref:DUF397 domain-containing protein n=1 Tax=Streptomyces sp. NPDC087440 TaxID=3365790 RepID=UPI00382B1D44